MNELNPFEQDLADRLRRQATAVDIGDTPMATVVRRGRHRSDRRKVAIGVAAVATLSGTAIGTIQLLSDPTPPRFLASTDSDPSDETPNGTVAVSAPDDDLAPVTRIPSNLVWNVVEPGSTEALGSVIWDNTALAGQKPPYLAWSSAPGKSANEEFIPTLYRSDDGVHWQPAGGESFTQPDISMRGVGSRNGRMFAFGTAAATAAIPNGGGGEVVVDVSDDQGASWRDITLPIDLRGLAASEGVQSVGFQGDMVASDAGVVAIGVPLVNLDPSLFANGGGSYIAQRDGAISVTYPTCGRDVTVTTISMQGGYASAKTTGTAISAPADTAPADATTTTTNVGVIGTEPADVCTADSAPTRSDLIPWSELGIDGNAVAAMFAPRVFVSSDGETFVEGSFPALPDGVQMAQFDVSATDTGFIATAQLYDPLSEAGSSKLYASADGMAWTESDMPSGLYNIVNVLSNGTVVAFGSDMTGLRPFTAVSTDGVEWSKLTLASLLDPEDGKSAELNIWLSAAGPSGIIAIAGINVDAALEAGGFSIEKDGVRLTMTESRYQSMVATDVATGEELGRWDGRTPPGANATLGYDEQGRGFRVLNPDGSVRVSFTDTDMQGFYDQQGDYVPKSVVLHSTDGINWSRDDVSPIVGFDSFGATRVQVTDSSVLISMVDPNSRDAEGTAKTVVLVGTAKS
jgi:hypothetical protein